MTCIICFLAFVGFSQRGYDSLLSARLKSIKNLRTFDNTATLCDDTVAAGMDFPYWSIKIIIVDFINIIVTKFLNFL